MLFLVLLVSGTAAGMALAYTAVWASESFSIGPQAVAILFVVSGLTGVIINPLLGLLSDKIGHRRYLIAGQLVLTSIAYLGYTQATTYEMALGLVAVSGLGVMGVVLAMVDDLVGGIPEVSRGEVAQILAAERTGFSIGIILGPAIAAAIVSLTGGTHAVFVTAAVIQVAACGLVFKAPEKVSPGRPRRPATTTTAGVSTRAPGRKVGMGVFLVGLMLLMLPAQTRNMYLPLFVTRVLGEAPGTVGPLFTLNACVAVITMPYVGVASDRIGAHRLLYIGACAGAAYCLAQSVAGTYGQTLAIQMMVGFAIALWSAASLIYLQRLMPENAGMAGGLYVAVQQFTPVVSGLILGPVAEGAGIPMAFAVTGGLSLVALALLVLGHGILTKPGNTHPITTY